MTKLYRSLGLLAVLFVAAAAGQTRGQDKVEFTDRKDANKTKSISGELKEDSVAGVKVLIAKKDEFVAAPDIVRVTYADLPAVLKLEYGSILTAEDRKEFDKARKSYLEVLPKLPAGSKSKRQVEYRLAMLAAQVADGVENGPAAAQAALEKYIDANKTGWQFSSAAKTLVRMQVASEKFDDALKTLEAMAEAAGLPKEVKQEAELLTIDVLIRSGKAKDAAAKIDAAIASLPANDPQRQRLSVYQIAADGATKPEEKIKKLDAIIAGTADESMRALAFNTLGDCHREAKQNREAMWAYMWVDVVYNKDRGEHLKAMDRLAKLFGKDAMNDPEREKQYLDKLARLR